MVHIVKEGISKGTPLYAHKNATTVVPEMLHKSRRKTRMLWVRTRALNLRPHLHKSVVLVVVVRYTHPERGGKVYETGQ